MTPVFLDAGYVVALEVNSDQHHKDAVSHWRPAIANRRRLVTTSFVFDEIVTFLSRRGQHARAIDVGDRLLDSELVEFVWVDRPLFDAGWSYFRKHADKTYSLTDCISFVVMEQRAIRTAFTFDRHFRQAGFDVEP